MHSCIATLLSILAILSPALGILTANDLPYHDPQSPQTPVESCLRRYHNYDAAYGKLPYQTVFFRHPDESHFELAILTAYIEFYPHTLKAWLEERNFTIRDFSDSTDSDLCGWREYESVVVSGRRHGQIGWRRNNLYLNAGASQSSNSTSVEGASGSYISHIDPIKPSHDTVEVVKNILLNNTPYADIYSTRCFWLEFGIGMLGFGFGLYTLTSFAIHRERKKKLKALKDSDDIELDQIRVQDLSGSGMHRIETNDADVAKFDIEVTKQVMTRSSPSSTGGGIATPPPMYTLDGAGRSAVSVRDMV
ncbi:hypothetical protein N0V91_011272 [Didymella pomorum]|uniref:Uncharacterized protein n=1 Tax=Didymella pomorum TaxID=749634 RepID=A0A9W8YU23_9PLEO|nr:hypothetical protein N0V91_011272 [Didymella pomorum]